MPKYNDYNIKYNKITINLNNQQVKNIANIDETKPYWHAKVFIKIYELQNVRPNSKIQIKIKYNDVEIALDIFHKHFEKKYLLSTTILFKNDYELFTHYYNYYSHESVEFFYIYYNSMFNEDIEKLFEKSNVKLFEWNFDYWSNRIMDKHVAQTGQINHCFYKYSIYI